MAIRVVCSKGHVLNVKDHLAGKTGLCPSCQARVEVPMPHEGEFSEDSILSLLGPHEGVPAPHAPLDLNGVAEDARSGATGMSPPPKKACPRCDRPIDAGTRVCPYCNTYVVGVGDL